MKKCRTCGKMFPPTLNQVRKHDFKCKKCANSWMVKYRVKRKVEGNPVVTGRMSAKWHREYLKKYYLNPENRERRNRQTRDRNKKKENAIKVMARTITHHAIERGELKKTSCIKCGAKAVEAHHRDYTRPLLVEWLCRKCHRAEHAKTKESKR